MASIFKNFEIDSETNFVITSASIEDTAPIVQFLNKIGGETDFLTFGLNQFPFSIEEEKKIILACLEKYSGLMLVAKIHDEIVSHLFIEISNRARLDHIGYLGISVTKQYWRKSIGTHMVLIAIDWGKKNGLTKLQVQVRTDNAAAIRLYTKLGFCIEGTITHSFKIGTTYFDDYVMGLKI